MAPCYHSLCQVQSYNLYHFWCQHVGSQISSPVKRCDVLQQSTKPYLHTFGNVTLSHVATLCSLLQHMKKSLDWTNESPSVHALTLWLLTDLQITSPHTYFEEHVVQVSSDGHLATVSIGLGVDVANHCHTSWGVWVTNLCQLEEQTLGHTLHLLWSQ